MEKASGGLEPKYIGSQEVVSQRDSVTAIHTKWAKHRFENAPQTLHHYTTADGFFDIIKSGKLYATHIRYLNDQSEYVHAIMLMHEIIDSMRREKKWGAIKYDPLGIMKVVLSTLRFETIPPIFVTCFSEARDELTQWRSYGQGEGGIALALDTKMLAAAVSTHNIEIHPVEYVDARKQQLIVDIMQWGLTRIQTLMAEHEEYQREEWVQEWMTHFTYHSAFFAPLFKHSSFKREDEWRILKWSADPGEIEVMKSAKGLRLRVILDVGCEVKTQYGKHHRIPVKEVVIGPNPHMPITKLAVLRHLEKNSYFGVDVTPSEIPYRSM